MENTINGKKIFLASCLNGFTAPEWINCLLGATNRLNIASVALHPGSIDVFHARNELTAAFLGTDCTHLLFIDSDLVFTPEHIERITSHDVDLVGGCYPIKNDGPLQLAVNDYHEPKPERPDGLHQVRYVATGFMLIARSVFERILEVDRAKIEFQSDHPPHNTIWNFFRPELFQDKERMRRLTEDWFFCQRWLELGGEVFVDRHVFLHHIGKCVFPLQSQMAQMAVAAQGEPGEGHGHVFKIADMTL